jgi:hypothetical protein
VSMGMVRQVPRSGSGTRRERGRYGAEGQHQRVPAMGTEKRRGRGEGTGAGDGEVWPETVRNGAADGGVGATDCGRCGTRCRRAAAPLTLRAFRANQAPPTSLPPSAAMTPLSMNVRGDGCFQAVLT